ncbi:hypothetical protein GTR04_3145 [Trichophyton interdigitale]|uniref:Uncharacterized protein n=1 Tax=Trichophyton interdigitale TaxID=101480 RepID=A0A9P4YNN9_9EURO|nr:hypothetical protein GY631_0482 [Trichophyton interdigitale]KAF3900875.1 hypothetical protein GY632_0430 [Trichophyton interdigitale]KAG8209489.1 hypothetical protein GTR04_3145 [Trichophyton interdigitale]
MEQKKTAGRCKPSEGRGKSKQARVSLSRDRGRHPGQGQEGQEGRRIQEPDKARPVRVRVSSLLACVCPGSQQRQMGKDEVGSGLCVPPCPPRWSRAARRLGRFPLLVFGPVSTCVFVSQQEVEAGETGPQSVLISHIPSLPFVRRTVVAAAVKGTVQAGSRQPPF